VVATMIVLSLQLIGMWLYATRRALLQTNGRVPTWRDVEPWIRIAAVFATSIVVHSFIRLGRAQCGFCWPSL
jgi:hypothetical protein